MKAIILAAGYGNRMRPLTDSEHKTLLRIADSTIIDRIVDGLLSNGVSDVIVALGYRALELRGYLERHYSKICNFTFVLNERYRETNNIHTLALVFEQCEIDDDVILIESDLVLEPKIIEKVIRSPYPTVALVDHYRSGMDGTVVALDGNKVVNVIPPHLQGNNFDFSDKYKTLNVYKFSKEFCKRDFKKILTYYSRTIDDNCYYELILGILIYMHRESIYAEIVDGMQWAEVDDPNDLRIAEYKFNTRKRKEILDRAWGGYWSYPIVDFAFIRNMHFPPASAISELKNNLQELIFNYGSSQKILNEKLSYFTILPPDTLVLLNGAAQAFPFFKKWFEGKRIAIPSPTFGEYSEIFPTADKYLDDGENYQSSFNEMCLRSDVDVIVIVNPNNPTGSLIRTEIIFDCIKKYPEKFFIIDESFIDFSGDTSIETLDQYYCLNFLVLKSLSKVLGIPGVRLGYAYTKNTALRQGLMNEIPVWNTNSIAEFFLEILLKHKKSYAASIEKTKTDRDDFIRLLSESPAVLKAYPSYSNFILVKINCQPEKITDLANELLNGFDMYIKSCSQKFNDGSAYIRLAVRLPEENKRLVENLTDVWMKIK